MKRLLSRPCRVNAMYQIVCGIQYRANLNSHLPQVAELRRDMSYSVAPPFLAPLTRLTPLAPLFLFQLPVLQYELLPAPHHRVTGETRHP